jgi:hypothetical protein
MATDEQMARAASVLGKYFGVPDSSAKLNWLNQMKEIQGVDVSDAADSVNANAGDPVLLLLNSLMTNTGPCPSTAAIIEKIKSMITSTDADASDNIANQLSNVLRIGFEPDAFSSFEDPSAKTAVKYLKDPKRMQGTMPLKKPEIFSIKQMLEMSRWAGHKKPEQDVNESPNATGTTDKPILSILQVFGSKNDPGAKDVGAAQLFLSAIPTYEMSRCIPFLDIVIIQPGEPLAADGKIQSMGLASFLAGGTPAGEVTKNLAQAMHLDTVTDIEGLQKRLQGDSESVEPFSTAGMEMFLSPQTLVPESESDKPTVMPYSPGQTSIPVGAGSPQSRLDRFRPLAGIKSFSINIKTSYGSLNFKTAELVLQLYDRTRLHELAPLVKPEIFASGKLFMKVTSGWSHPDGQPGTSERENPVGEFLNSLKSVDLFVVTNSSFSLEDDGTTTVTIKLVTSGGESIRQVRIADSFVSAKVQGWGQQLVKAVNKLQKHLVNTPAPAPKINVASFLNNLNSTSKALSATPEMRRKINAFLKKKDPAAEDLNSALTELYGDPTSKKDVGVVSKYKFSVPKQISAKVNSLQKTPDPFIRSMKKEANDFVSPVIRTHGRTSKKANYISLGKILLTFVGEPLAAHSEYDEVQFLFYDLNPRATFVAGWNLAQFPIETSEFLSLFSTFAKRDPNMTVERFLQFIKSEFVSRPSAHAYGFRSLYGWARGTPNRELTKTNKDPSVLQNENSARCRAAYGDEGELIFRLPRMAYTLEAVPIQSTTTESEFTGARKLLRMHIYDGANSYAEAENALLRAAFDDATGIITGLSTKLVKAIEADGAGASVPTQLEFQSVLAQAVEAGILEPIKPSTKPEATRFRIKGGFEGIKRFLQFNTPTITYGSNSSMLTNVSLSTQNNPLLAAIARERSTGEGVTGAPGQGAVSAPTQLAPVQASFECIGCPVLHHGQQFFMDFSTGTSLDNIYRITEVSHAFAPGEFKTSVKAINMETHGEYRALENQVSNALQKIESWIAEP